MQVGLYARISNDPNGTELGVARQEKDARRLARTRGWKIADTYVDNDLSAYQRRVVRPEFERLVTDLDEGRIDGIITYDLDRLMRQPRDLERVIDVYDERKRRGLAFATLAADYDLSTSDGRMMARVMVAAANKSSMDTARRVERKLLEQAQNGVPRSAFRPFGWKEDRLTLDRREARLVRQAVDDVLAGVGLTTICTRWNADGVPTARGKAWRPNALRAILLSPRMVGYRVHQREICRDDDGQPVRMGEPMIDEPTWEAVRALLVDPSRKTGGPGRKFLLTGVLICGKCLGRMSGSHNAYKCQTKVLGGCRGTSILAERIDADVVEVLMEHLGELPAEAAADHGWAGESDLKDTERRLRTLQERYASGDVDDNVFYPTQKRLSDRAQALRAERASALRATLPAAARPANVLDGWEGYDLDRRRAAIAAHIEQVVVSPAKARRYDENRVRVYFRP